MKLIKNPKDWKYLRPNDEQYTKVIQEVEKMSLHLLTKGQSFEKYHRMKYK